MKDSIPNTLKDLQIAKPVYYKNHFIVLREIQSYEPPMQQAEKVSSPFLIGNECTKLQTKPKIVQFISTCGEQGDGYLTFTHCFKITASFN